MQGRSWMAALTPGASALLGLVLGLGLPAAGLADDARPTPPATTATPRPPDATSAPTSVLLDLNIAGLGPKGCDVEIAPGHMGCKFRPVSQHLGREDGGKAKIRFDDVQTTVADRYCMFAITIREPGQPAKTVHRGLRLVATSSDRNSPQLLTCYLSSPSKLAKASEMRDRR